MDIAMGNNWRVPNVKELDSLVEEACFNAAINETFFPATQTYNHYWSSSPYANDSSAAWIVNFFGGNDNFHGKYNNNYVRLVRSSQ